MNWSKVLRALTRLVPLGLSALASHDRISRADSMLLGDIVKTLGEMIVVVETKNHYCLFDKNKDCVYPSMQACYIQTLNGRFKDLRAESSNCPYAKIKDEG
jgi:hypothetical protein